MNKTMKVGIVATAAMPALTGCFNNTNSSSGQEKKETGQQVGSTPSQSPASANVPWIASKNTTRITALFFL
ncbi:hypothetical protein [Paenibacillus tyrfis]|uniref:hypothetical protein n=1 Tax=Paenibacillus tyrfis TaxID=1501230 RepID=UPI00209E9EB9|nr:hypothetical protein [Paenibacillus tyrfis]MCP1307470.1 hypothetical protein [Paenibacillus tyrfis]